jgi:septum formation protein
MKSLILASKSPFRKQLMENAGLIFEIKSATIDERALEKSLQEQGKDAMAIALHLASAKARHINANDECVIGSDQTLSLNGQQFHKPKNKEEAREHLRRFSNKTHHLNSAVVIAHQGKIIWQHCATAHMTVRPLSEVFIEHYLQKMGEKVLSSVGAYQFEGLGIQLFEKIEGDYFTIIGLPLLPLLAQLRILGLCDE